MVRTKDIYKIRQEENSLDMPCKFNFRKSERQAGKKQIRDGLNEATKEEITDDLVWEVEMILAARCEERIKSGLATECMCLLPETLSLKELLEILNEVE